ncbi:MAG: hypothetical protein JO030_08745, partial [Candidatus Eremiobacteraeota bacterium]|nr:hypothetical protein [Candidatus Eremiobacteraeota bacterium]
DRLRPLLFALGLAIATGCGGNAMPGGTAQSSLLVTAPSPAGSHLKKPALITLDLQGGELEYWQVHTGGSSTTPMPFTASLGLHSAYGMVGDGATIAIANNSPAEVVAYNVRTKKSAALPDPYGNPIDIAIDKRETLYVLNLNNVAVYRAGASKPTELTCQYVNSAVAIAANDEGDVFVNGYGPGSFMGVVEFRRGRHACTKLNLQPEEGYIAGVGVDPKTDDLIVVDNPDLCAGGYEGRMRIYSKPYGPKYTEHNLNANYCAGTFRLDASSTRIFVSDSTISDGYPVIDQRSYPDAADEGTYSGGYGSHGSFGGFTTIPNTLPN